MFSADQGQGRQSDGASRYARQEDGRQLMLRAIAATALFLTGILAASSPAYAASLEPLSYKEALSRFNATDHDSPGVWLCGYSITDQHFTMREGMSTSLVEVDERFLYLRNNGEIVELGKGDRFIYPSCMPK